ncbi:NAD-P-binding protein [Artomyces pyxidatus]|uniref:NAD-P-binding protein n=1 Tax=Artomyces pyxidatus TaxID=48021 RepID=A0ACB8TDM6_9AGAM|nr:NAD-P-binding protein [Artomyces pyxidatus]
MSYGVFDAPLGGEEDLPVTMHHDIYPTIDPEPHFAAKTFKGKVVLVTGASRGIGAEIALHYGRAGADLALVGRKQAFLDATKAAVLAAVPDARVLTFALDVVDTAAVEAAVNATVEHFGRLDVLVPNAGVLRPFRHYFINEDPNGWWKTLEINLRGVYNFTHFALPHLMKTKGNIIVISSMAAQMRGIGGTDYCISKHALGRFTEFVVLEYPDVKMYSLHPGAVATEMNDTSNAQMEMPDQPRLSAATCLYLSAGKAEYLSGRYVAALWDLAEVERDWKDKIVAQHALVSKLAIPA